MHTANARSVKAPAASAPAAPPGHEVASHAPPAEPVMRVLRQFRQVFNGVKTHFQQMEKHAGVGGAQIWALSIVRDRPGIGVNELARAIDVRQPTASNLVRSLVEQDCIEIRKEGADKRAVQLYVKAAGRQVLQRTPGPFTGVLPEALAALPPATLRRLEEDLGVLLAAVNRDLRDAQIPLAELTSP